MKNNNLTMWVNTCILGIPKDFVIFAVQIEYTIMNLQTIALIGAGNLATHLALALANAGHKVKSIYSPSGTSASELAKHIGNECMAIAELEQLPLVDIYIIAVTDDALCEIVEQWPEHCKGRVVVHTAGSVPMSILAPLNGEYGVFYPLQTFSKNRPLDFTTIPCFIEANSEKTSQKLLALARTISQSVMELDSDGRMHLHLAAVFACNFVNHLYDVSSQLLENKGVDIKWLEPLIIETASKALILTPRKAQTGPAVRGNKSVMDKHLHLLVPSPNWQKLYSVLSNSIYQTFHP